MKLNGRLLYFTPDSDVLPVPEVNVVLDRVEPFLDGMKLIFRPIAVSQNIYVFGVELSAPRCKSQFVQLEPEQNLKSGDTLHISVEISSVENNELLEMVVNSI